MFRLSDNCVQKKSEAHKLPNWLVPPPSKAEFGKSALFQTSFAPVNPTTEKSNKNLNAKNFGEINYFADLEIMSQAEEVPKNDKTPKGFNLSRLGEELKSFTKELYKPKKRKDADLFEKVETLEEEKSELMKENVTFKAENEKLQVSLNMLKFNSECVYKELENVRATLSSNQTQLDSIKDANIEFESFKRNYSLQQTELKKMIKNKVENLQSEKTILQNFNQRLEGANKEMQLKIERLESSEKESKSKMEDLESENMKLKSEIAGLESAEEESKSKMGDLENENMKLKSEIENLGSENQELKSTIESLEGAEKESKSKMEDLESANVKLKLEIEELKAENLKIKSANVFEKSKAEPILSTSKSPVKSILKSPAKSEAKTNEELNPVSPRNKRKLFVSNDNGSKSVRFNEQKLIRYTKSDSQSTGKGVDMSFVKKSILGEPKRTILTTANKNQDKKSETVFDTLDEMDCFMDDF